MSMCFSLFFHPAVQLLSFVYGAFSFIILKHERFETCLRTPFLKRVYIHNRLHLSRSSQFITLAIAKTQHTPPSSFPDDMRKLWPLLAHHSSAFGGTKGYDRSSCHISVQKIYVHYDSRPTSVVNSQPQFFLPEPA